MVQKHTRSGKSSHKRANTFAKLTRERNTAFKRFPLVFTLLGTFGLVSVLYGVQHLFDKVPYLVNNPILALIVGLVVLLITGTLYKKLG